MALFPTSLDTSRALERYRIDTTVIIGEHCVTHEMFEWCRAAGRKGTIVFGTGRSVAASVRLELLSRFSDQGFAVSAVDGARADMPYAALQRMADSVSAAATDWIVAIGGGSVIDAAKLLALRSGERLAVQTAHSVPDLQQRLADSERLPLFVAPTCVGSGAEVNALADVVTDRGVRVPLVSPRLYPDVAVLDNHVATPPPFVQAAAFVDAVTHLLDPWLNGLPGPISQTPMTAAMLRSLVGVSRDYVSNQGLDASAFVRLSTASHLAVRPGLVRPSAHWSSLHRIEHVISPRLGLLHGEGLALLLPAFLRWMESERADALRDIADELGAVFNQMATPSLAVTAWLRSIPLGRCSLELSNAAIDSSAALTIDIFGDASGYLPGRLHIDAAAVKAILSFARDPISEPRPTTHSVNSLRVFGTLLETLPRRVAITPIPEVFERVSRAVGRQPTKGWFSTIRLGAEGNNEWLLVLVTPGGQMVRDCLTLLSQVDDGFESIVFVGLAGALAPELNVGDLVSPAHAQTHGRIDHVASHRVRLDNAPRDVAFRQERPWTIRSVPSLTEESESLLNAWRWAGIDLVDLESSCAATWAASHGIPFSAWLAVSDRPLEGAPLWARPPLQADVRVSKAIDQLATVLIAAASPQNTIETEETV